MNRTQIYLTKTQIETLRQIAQKRKVSISEIIRSLIREKLEKTPIKKEGLLSVAKRINKIGIKGPKDLATRLDKYLYGGK
jgi:predicted DNA-binding ribbon-helix-helix protein